MLVEVTSRLCVLSLLLVCRYLWRVVPFSPEACLFDIFGCLYHISGLPPYFQSLYVGNVSANIPFVTCGSVTCGEGGSMHP